MVKAARGLRLPSGGGHAKPVSCLLAVYLSRNLCNVPSSIMSRMCMSRTCAKSPVHRVLEPPTSILTDGTAGRHSSSNTQQGGRAAAALLISRLHRMHSVHAANTAALTRNKCWS